MNRYLDKGSRSKDQSIIRLGRGWEGAGGGGSGGKGLRQKGEGQGAGDGRGYWGVVYDMRRGQGI